jgi:pentose-5-phosphate-3-epimerase
MIVEPERNLTDFAKAGADHLLVNAEPSATSPCPLANDVRHEATIHYVNVNPVGSCRIDRTNLLGETSKIRRQDRRRDNDRPARHPA